MSHLDLQELVSLLAPDLATFLAVFSPLVQHCQQEAASTKMVSHKFQSPLLSLSKLMDVKTSSGSCPVPMANLLVSSDHWLADPSLLAGGAEVVSLSFLGLFLFPTLLLEKELATRTSSIRGRQCQCTR